MLTRVCIDARTPLVRCLFFFSAGRRSSAPPTTGRSSPTGRRPIRTTTPTTFQRGGREGGRASAVRGGRQRRRRSGIYNNQPEAEAPEGVRERERGGEQQSRRGDSGRSDGFNEGGLDDDFDFDNALYPSDAASFATTRARSGEAARRTIARLAWGARNSSTTSTLRRSLHLTRLSNSIPTRPRLQLRMESTSTSRRMGLPGGAMRPGRSSRKRAGVAASADRPRRDRNESTLGEEDDDDDECDGDGDDRLETQPSAVAQTETQRQRQRWEEEGKAGNDEEVEEDEEEDDRSIIAMMKTQLKIQPRNIQQSTGGGGGGAGSRGTVGGRPTHL